MPTDLLIRNLPAFLFLLLRILLVGELRTRRVVLLKAYRDAIYGLPTVLKERRPAVQGLRRIPSAEIASQFTVSRGFRQVIEIIMFKALLKSRLSLYRIFKRVQGALR